MSATPQDVQAKIAEAEAFFKKTTSGYASAKKPGVNWTNGLTLLDQASTEAGQLVAPAPPPPAVTYGARTMPQGPFTDHTSALTYRMGADGSGTAITVAKQSIHDAPDYGLALMQWDPPTAAPTVKAGVTDVEALRIGHTPPTSNGTAEVGAWYGIPTVAERVLAHGTVAGMWWGAQCRDSQFTDQWMAVLNADGSLGKLPAHGGYFEHGSRRIVLEYATIRASAHGLTFEWWYEDPANAAFLAKEYQQAPAGKAGPIAVEIRYCDIQGDEFGVFWDAGNCGHWIHDCKISGNVGISQPANLAIPSMPNRIDLGTIEFQCNQNVVTNQNPIG